ncbi:MAG: M81 family metallopeptidase [Candidatus Latescibacteria bacterium]|jgi:microcystin degradation protein MlrC|nr:M81 family metallopeptidase [Candidatus Latescibacterota bacterium]MBT4140714.1 M81 family metallopeptidase [Candidatus Latescibacterota bacterium]MBT5832751.1 M81 family metallopeptidase [Candidatus Latescibacterota bacterium]
MRIGIIGLWHETNTFAMERNDTMDSVRIQRGEEILQKAHPKGFIGGFAEGASRDGIELVPGVDIRFGNGGIIGCEMYEMCQREIMDAFSGMGTLDGVYFAFHGAMVAEDPYTDAEGDIVRAAREWFGTDLPMVATYDFHAIMSRWENENVVPFPNDTNPHIDGYERGLEAAGCLLQMLDGQVQPLTRRLFVPIIGPNIGQSTWSHVPEQEKELLLYQLNEARAELEKAPGVINITILGGYGYGDSPDVGMSIVTTTDNDEALAKRMCVELGQALWDRRAQLLQVRPILSIDDGVREAMARDQKPVMLVDLGDDPGSACPADSPAVLEALIRLGAKDCALTIRDADVVEAGMKVGVGAELTMEVGGKVDQRFYQPLTVTGTVRAIDDGNYMILGPTHGGWGREVNEDAFREANVGPRVVLRIGNKVDVVFSRHRTGKDRDFFKSAGVILEEKQILVVKSNQAHRASFDPIVASTIELASPGVSTVDYASLPYKHLIRPIWPIDPEMIWSADEEAFAR